MIHARWALPALLAVAAAAPLGAQQRLAMASDTITRPAGEADERPRGLVSREELITDRLRRLGIPNPDPAPTRPKTRADSVAWEQHRRAADRVQGQKIVVSIYDRRLWLIGEDGDTLISARAGVGMGVVFGPKGIGRRDFSTPRGPRRVLGKEENPLWNPPDWHYEGLHPRVRQFPAGGVAISDGSRLVRRGKQLGLLRDGEFEPLSSEHPLVFDDVMYIPPFGTVNRQIPEVLGAYKLDTGDGILIHGTNDPLAIGFPATHGCIRLDEEPLEELYSLVEVGTPVYIY